MRDENKCMKSICLLSFFLTSFMINTGAAQQKEIYPDSLKGIVLKIEPLSFLYDHLSGGVEFPVGKNFLDILGDYLHYRPTIRYSFTSARLTAACVPK